MSISKRQWRTGVVVALSIVALLVGAVFTNFGVLAQPPFAAADNSDLPPTFQKLVPLHTALTKPRPGDWLERHVELGQTYREYIDGKAVRSDAQRRTIYVQPLGEFDDAERKILERTAA